MYNIMTGKFIASYSGGKDSMLAIYRAINQGLIPDSFIITYNIDMARSWFHGIPEAVLESVSEAVGVPVRLMRTSGPEYTENFEKALKEAKERGVTHCVFGDIDIEGHRVWCTERCEAAGIEAFFPLWGEERADLVHSFIESGFKTHITIVDTSRMPESFLGRILTAEAAKEIALSGADICGENGEYHTFVSDGPLFKHPVNFSFGSSIKEEPYAILPILPWSE